jgi:hypothetical protein
MTQVSKTHMDTCYYFDYQTCMFTTHTRYTFDYYELYFVKMGDE